GFGALTSLPEGASGFTTLELKSNFLGTAVEGVVTCEARLSHGGRSTQVWDAVVSDRDSGRTLALFRCTQMILYPR
ncbi:MAG: PaaI family thioesterase, partial [Gammaproteobacteria bacterium]